MYILNKRGWKKDPCGTPGIVSLNWLYDVLSLVLCALFLRQEQRANATTLSNRKASSFVVSKSWSKQWDTLERLVRKIPGWQSSSRDLLFWKGAVKLYILYGNHTVI